MAGALNFSKRCTPVTLLYIKWCSILAYAWCKLFYTESGACVVVNLLSVLLTSIWPTNVMIGNLKSNITD